jgi:ribosome recycling factor
MRAAKRQKDDKTLSEDDVKAVEKAVDALMSDYQHKVEEAFKTKEKDILTI